MDQDFSKMCGNFVYDLRCYDSNKGSHDRLDKTGHEFYLGKPYFSDAVVTKILAIPTMLGTLQNDLRKLSEMRQDSAICAAHDLAPLFGAVLLVRWEKENKKAVPMHADLPDVPGPPVQGQSSSGTGKSKGKKVLDSIKNKSPFKGSKDNEPRW